MKFLVSLLLGVLTGAALFLLVLIYNPFTADRKISPLAVSNDEIVALNFSAVPSDSIVFTNDGESRPQPHPAKVQQLWEAPVRDTQAMATAMRDARGNMAGIGIKFSSLSERTRLLQGDALVDSVWYVYLPGRGSVFIEQSENYWSFFRDVGWPAVRSGANSWKGRWIGDLTAGPGVLGTARVTGGTGVFRGLEMEAVESLIAEAYSADSGPIAADGRLLIEVPDRADRAAETDAQAASD